MDFSTGKPVLYPTAASFAAGHQHTPQACCDLESALDGDAGQIASAIHTPSECAVDGLLHAPCHGGGGGPHLHLRLKPDTRLDTSLAQARECFQSVAVALATRHKLSALSVGYTEIPLALKQMAGLNLVDPAGLLAQALAQRA